MSSSTPTKTVFLIIDVQNGFLSPHHWGPSRSNSKFEFNTTALLQAYRALIASSPLNHKIIHIAHSSLSPSSPLHPSSPGFQFQTFAQPKEGELVITKSVNSAFIGTDLEEMIRRHFGKQGGKVYLAGLTTDHCVSTTTRMAGNLGVADGSDGERGEVVFVEDATAAWKKGDGEGFFDAEIVHKVHAESLAEFASVVKTESVLEQWRGWMA